MKVLIVEGDIEVSSNYEAVCRSLDISHISSVQDLSSIDTVLESFTPDIVLVDVYLNNKVSLELIPRFQSYGAKVLIITAYSENEVYKRALDYNVDGFLTKPINLSSFKYTLLRVMGEIKSEKNAQFIFHSSKNKLTKISNKDILYFETEGNYTSVYTKERRFLLKKSLKTISDQLADERFVQIFRNVIVNFDHVESMDFTTRIMITDFGKSFQIGDKYKSTLKKYSKTFKVI